jgi:hypothetical protein
MGLTTRAQFGTCCASCSVDEWGLMSTIDLGDPVPDLAIETRDSAGVLSDAGSVGLVITKPDNTTDSPTVNHTGTGQYSADYVPTDPGHYNVRWVATGVNTSAYADSFDVLEANPRYIVSLSDAKTLLNFTGTTTSDEELRRYNEAATWMIEQYLDETVVRTAYVGEKHCVGGSLTTSWYPGSGPYGRYKTSVFVDHRPIISLTSITSVDGLYTWDPNLLYLDTSTGEITPLPGSPGLFGDLLVDYVAGYQIIPANYQEAARLIIQHLWATRRGLGGNLITQQLPGFNIGFAIPQAVKDLLGPQAPVFA